MYCSCRKEVGTPLPDVFGFTSALVFEEHTQVFISESVFPFGIVCLSSLQPQTFAGREQEEQQLLGACIVRLASGT